MRLPSLALSLSLASGMAAANGGSGMQDRDGQVHIPTEVEMTDTCQADDHQHLVGQPFETAQALSFSGPVRIFGPDAALTMDHRPDRIDFQYDRDGLIVRVYCG